MAESFFASLETELIDRSSWRTRADARLAVFDYIEAFYTLGPGLLVTRRVREEVPFRRDRRLTYRRPSTEAGQLHLSVPRDTTGASGGLGAIAGAPPQRAMEVTPVAC